MSEQIDQYDAIVIGGGPGGATAAMVMARAGLRVLVLEKSRFPRFHIGESILPRNFPLIQELGLEQHLKPLPQMPKYGAEFAMGDGSCSVTFGFEQGLLPGSPTFNIARAPFDQMLLQQAEAAGAEVRQSVGVRRIAELADDAVGVQIEGQVIRGRWLIDASGQATVVGRHLGIRRAVEDPQLQKVAYFSHFKKVERLPGRMAGHPGIVMAREGWFWLIAVDETTTSVGFVAHPDLVKQIGVAPQRALRWAIERCPVMRRRLANAVGPDANEVIADFSYRCDPSAGPGYFLVGDAASFLDPIFSTGVTLAMMSGLEAAKHVVQIVRASASADQARRRYVRFLHGSTEAFWRLIRRYYQHSFRELFLNGGGPLAVHRAVISILAGQVFPRPPFALRWRLRLFELFVWLNRYLPLVPRRPEFSLLGSAAAISSVEKGAEVEPA